MTHEEKLKQIPVSTFEDIELVELHDIIKPHTYMITPKHLLPDRMYLNEDSIREAEKTNGAVCDICKHANRRDPSLPILSFDQHKKEATIVFIKINAKDREPKDIPHLQEYLKSIADKLTELGIDGVSLVDVTNKKDE